MCRGRIFLEFLKFEFKPDIFQSETIVTSNVGGTCFYFISPKITILPFLFSIN